MRCGAAALVAAGWEGRSRIGNTVILGCVRKTYRAILIRMITFAEHNTMMMVMEMPSPGHFAMPRESRRGETGRLD